MSDTKVEELTAAFSNLSHINILPAEFLNIKLTANGSSAAISVENLRAV